MAADRVSDTESGRQVQRYIRLTCLEKPLLDLVDEGRIALSPAIELSYLSSEEQDALIDTIKSEDCTPSLSQAVRMRKLSEKGSLIPDCIFRILTEVKHNHVDKLKIPLERVRKYFPDSYTVSQIEDEIVKLCQAYQCKRDDRDVR